MMMTKPEARRGEERRGGKSADDWGYSFPSR